MSKPVTGWLAALSFAPALMLQSVPVLAQSHHVPGHAHYWYVERFVWAPEPAPWVPATYGPGVYRIAERPYYAPRWAANPYWRAEAIRASVIPNYFSSGVGLGSFACDWDPAYKMDPRCLQR